MENAKVGSKRPDPAVALGFLAALARFEADLYDVARKQWIDSYASFRPGLGLRHDLKCLRDDVDDLIDEIVVFSPAGDSQIDPARQSDVVRASKDRLLEGLEEANRSYLALVADADQRFDDPLLHARLNVLSAEWSLLTQEMRAFATRIGYFIDGLRPVAG